jgi:hypothetical protein
MTVTSLLPINSLEKQLSWKVDSAYETAHDLNCINCHVVAAEGGGGASVNLFSERYLWYTMAAIRLEKGSAIPETGRFLPRLETSVLANPVGIYKAELRAEVVADAWQTQRQSHFYQFSWGNSLTLGQNWDTRAIWMGIIPGDRSRASTYQEWSLTLNHYF